MKSFLMLWHSTVECQSVLLLLKIFLDKHTCLFKCPWMLETFYGYYLTFFFTEVVCLSLCVWLSFVCIWLASDAHRLYASVFNRLPYLFFFLHMNNGGEQENGRTSIIITLIQVFPFTCMRNQGNLAFNTAWSFC